MGRRAKFSTDQFLEAALTLVADHGPAAVTVSAVAGSVRAPIGSVYHRFVSRDTLLAELWLRTVESFQQDFLGALANGDGLQAALHTPRWVRAHPREGRVALLYRREELTSGKWPGEVKERAERLTRELDRGVSEFARRLFGSVTDRTLRRTCFALIDVPYAAVRKHLQAGEEPPDTVDELVRDTYLTILGRFHERGESHEDLQCP